MSEYEVEFKISKETVARLREIAGEYQKAMPGQVLFNENSSDRDIIISLVFTGFYTLKGRIAKIKERQKKESG
jgi:hypothetical protein